MTTKTIFTITGFAISILLEYTPYVSKLFKNTHSDTKRIIVILSLLITTAVLYAYLCYTSQCPTQGELIEAIIIIFTSNQVTHLLTPRSIGDFFNKK